MYFKEGHHSGCPHFHAWHGGAWASYAIDDLSRLGGGLPLQAERLVRKWARKHRGELLGNWDRARAGLDLRPIDPLK